VAEGPAGQPTAEEQDLIQRWQQIQSNLHSVGEADGRPGWFRDANLFLRRQDHWWCHFGPITKAMAETLKHYDQPPVQVAPDWQSLHLHNHSPHVCMCDCLVGNVRRSCGRA